MPLTFCILYLVYSLQREQADARLEQEQQFQIIRGQMTRVNHNLVRFINKPAHVISQRHNNVAVTALLPHNNAPIETAQPVVVPALPAMEVEVEPEVAEIRQGVARLSTCPRSLHELWREYEFGAGGYKAAKDFTEKERGADKAKYYRRNIVWKKVSELIRAGYSADQACDLIYRCYGRGCSVTKIINEMINDKKVGGHPGLRIAHR